MPSFRISGFFIIFIPSEAPAACRGTRQWQEGQQEAGSQAAGGRAARGRGRRQRLEAGRRQEAGRLAAVRHEVQEPVGACRGAGRRAGGGRTDAPRRKGQSFNQYESYQIVVHRLAALIGSPGGVFLQRRCS